MFEGQSVVANRADAFRVLVADDDPDALEVYALALKAADPTNDHDEGLTDLESDLFGEAAATSPSSDAATYELELCHQGDQAIEAVRAALAAGRPFAVAFLDFRMPPGPDGVETAERIRALDPDINIVFVTGYADLHPDDIAKRVGPIDKLLYCQKPVQEAELQQFTHALCAKWRAERNLVVTAQDLLATKERLQHLLTSSPAVIYSCAPGIDYAATFVSDNIEAILGYPASEFLEKPSFWLDHIHPEDMPNIRAKIEQVFRSQQVVCEYRIRHKDGQYRWLLDETKVVLDAEGNPIELVGYCIDITDRKTQQAALQHQALHDALTGLPNRNLLADRLDHGLSIAKRERTSLALLLLDLDHFKDVNDTLGHEFGDELLRQVTARLQGLIRTSDTLARLGGDELAIIQSELGQPDGAAGLAQRVIDALAQPFDLRGHEVVIGCSIGIALYPEDQTDPDHLLRNADLALYRAKADGRGIYRFFEQDMNIKLQQRKSLEAALRQALSHDQLELHYQPQIGLDGERVTGVEALIRWHHPEHGMIPPADFIPLAEETGIIIPITEWVLRRACLDARDWADFSVAVNLSPAAFKQQDLVGMVASILGEIGFDPSRLELEITETSLLQDTDRALTTLNDLKKLGVRVAMDDFGTGYSSLSYLQRFPFDKIKIDRSFIAKLTGDSDAAAIVDAVISLGRSLGMATTAEGVETSDQAVFLSGKGCKEVQGFYYARPMPAAEMATIVAATDDELNKTKEAIDHRPSQALG